VLRALDARAAADADVADLMAAVPALVRGVRYGNVRGTPTGSLTAVADALTARICAGLPAAAGGLADDAASRLREAMDKTHAALALRAQSAGGEAVRSRWLAALAGLAERRDVHGLIAGRVMRLLADAGAVGWPVASVRFAAALSAGVPATAKAAWAEGFLAGSGLLLVHDRSLLAVVDSWIASLDPQEFTQVLPLLRRTFGEFRKPERAGIGRAVRALAAAGPAAGVAAAGQIDDRRAAGAVRTVAAILGGAA
jgi:hypothetical protein